MNMNVQTPKKGFSLVELLISLTLFGLMLAAIASAGLLFLKLYVNTEDQAEFDRYMRYTHQVLGNDARMASQFKIIQSDDIRIIRNDGVNVDYFKETANGVSNLIRKEGSSSKILFRNVDSVKFSLVSGSNELLNVVINLKATHPSMPDSNRSMNVTFKKRG